MSAVYHENTLSLVFVRGSIDSEGTLISDPVVVVVPTGSFHEEGA